MNDISLCTNDECPLAVACLRAQHPPSAYQSFTCFEWSMHTDRPVCENFIAIEKKDNSGCKYCGRQHNRTDPCCSREDMLVLLNEKRERIKQLEYLLSLHRDSAEAE